ncbi:MAG TPA: HAD-IB family hydrolase, partial [Agitococcus sp.]|nr:HAD-IB family hydrolase [Agitococcus sp.]
MNLAIFDLDNTLIAGDSDHAWGEFLVDKNLVDSQWYKAQND